MRLVPLLVCLALGGCAASAGTSTDITGSTGKPLSPLARAAQASGGSDADWWKQGGVTREKISAMCWMKVESTAGKSVGIDKRADLANACVAETSKEHSLR